MKKILITSILLTALFAAGCSTLTDALYSEDVKTITLEKDAVMTAQGKPLYVENYVKQIGQLPPADKIIPAGTTIDLISYEPKKTITSGVELVSSFVPYGDLIGGIILSALGIGAGAIGTKVRKDKQLITLQDTEDRVTESYSRAIDDLRDLLDQTEGGEKVDDFLQGALAHHANKLQVLDKTFDFFRRYESPTKPKGGVKIY